MLSQLCYNKNLEVDVENKKLDEIFSDWLTGRLTFRPFIEYNKELDLIYTIVEDCSTTEEVVKGTCLSLLRRNHEEEGKKNYVGFEIWGARQFSKHYGMPTDGQIRVSDILLKMSEVDKLAMPAILDVAIPTLADYQIDIVHL